MLPRYGTTVRNPTRRSGESGYVPCCYCGLHYTKLGIARHWGRCPSNPRRVK